MRAGLLSAKRQYLRLRRERLAFDICAAPFGTGYFFSFRSIELPFNISIMQLAVFVVMFSILYALVAHIIGLILGILLFFVLVGGGIWFLRNLVALGLKDMDAALLKAPTIGPLYEVFFRKETYYREDTGAMYLAIVDAVTKGLVDEVTAAKGIKIAKRFDRPILDELNREKPNSPEPSSATPDEKANRSMSPIEEKLSDQFYQWERRGRGWHVFPEPVHPEPPFRPFYGHFLHSTPVVDDGRKPTFLSSLVEKLSRKLSTEPPPVPPLPETDEEPDPKILIRESLIELQTSLPAKLDISKDAIEQFLRNLFSCQEPVAFEMLGTPEQVSVQFAAHPNDASIVRRQLQSYFHEASFLPREGALTDAWESCEGNEILIVEFGLAREFMLSLECGKLDPFVGIVGALSELQTGELALFQVLFEAVEQPWSESIVNSVTHADGKPFFVNMPELASAAEKKVTRPLYAAVVRIAIKSESYDRTVEIARHLAGSLRVFANPQGNELIPLTNDDYPFEEHIEDVLSRQSRRSGMLLNSDELIGFVHLPSSDIRSPALERETGKTKAAPAIARNERGSLLGINVHIGKTVTVRLTPEQRVRHIHVIGASGTGKSTLLFNLIREDIENGAGVAVLDPHGDLVNKILGVIPQERMNDVVLVDPSDESFSIGLNILSAHSDLEKNLLSSDLVSVFERLSSTWGDQMNSVLQKAIHVFLESNERGTLADLRRFLIEPAYRTEFLKSVRDPELLYYWQKAFPQLTGNRSIGPVITRIDAFLAPKPIRYMVSQTENRLDFGQIMDSGKIFLAKLPEGLLGKENSYLLGTLLVSKFQQLAMSRQEQEIEARNDFWIYIDEFQNFITPSMAEILSGVRKYRIGLTLAHQELHQLEKNRDVASAVLSNPYTRVVFRVGDADAKRLSDGFAFFESRDFQNLETGQAICRIERADNDFNLTVPYPEAVDPAQAKATRQAVIAASRAKYGTPRADVEAALFAKFQSQQFEPKGAKPKSAPPKVDEAKAPEIPKPTVSEKEVPPAAAKTTATPEKEQKPERTPPDLGKGGAQHKAIQQRLKESAEQCGFYAVIEKEIPNGSIDLFVERAGHGIACEISVTTTIDHEVGNAQKCLRAGFLRVAVICQDEARLRKIENSIVTSLGPDLSPRVSYFQPDQFIAHLKELAATLAVPPLLHPRFKIQTNPKRMGGKHHHETAHKRRASCPRTGHDCPNGCAHEEEGLGRAVHFPCFRFSQKTGPCTSNGEQASMMRQRSLVRLSSGCSSASCMVARVTPSSRAISAFFLPAFWRNLFASAASSISRNMRFSVMSRKSLNC